MQRPFTIAVLTLSLLALLVACGQEVTPTAKRPGLAYSPGAKAGCSGAVGYLLGTDSNAGCCRSPPRDFHRRHQGTVHHRADAGNPGQW